MGLVSYGSLIKMCIRDRIKAWRLYSTGKPITEKSLALHYVEDEDGIRRIAETPIVGGLDIGSLAEMNEEMVHHRPDEKRKEEIKKQKQANGELKGKKAKTESSQKVTKTETTKPKKKKKERSSIVGKARWVIPPEGEPYRIRVNDVVNGIAQGVILQGFRGTGNPVSVPVDDLRDVYKRQDGTGADAHLDTINSALLKS